MEKLCINICFTTRMIISTWIYHTYPSLKSPADQAELWNGTLDGSINSVATDEICCSLQLKTIGDRIDDTTGGNAGVEPRLSVMYHEMVTQRGYSLEICRSLFNECR